MAHDVIMPKIGMYMEDIRLVDWLVDEGAEVAAGEFLFTLETDKVTSDVEAESAGFLHRAVAADSMVPIGGVVGAIAASYAEYEALVGSGPEGDPGDGGRSEAGAGFEAAQSALFLDYIRASEESPVAVPAEPPATREESSPLDTGSRKISPRARALIAEAGLAREIVETIPATGPGGRLTDKDVRAHLERDAPAPRAVTSPAPLVEVAVSEVRPLRGRRRVIARRMMESLQTTAQLTSVLEIDAGRIVEWRSQADPRPSYTTIFIAICAEALRRHPIVNSRVTEDAIELLADVNVAFAVDLGDGLVAPVVMDADKLSLSELEARVSDLTGRARAGSLALAELDGGTFTLSNSGTAPVDITTAIINPPQAAILWLGRIRDRPVAVDGAVVVRPTVQACLTYDHRVIDGVPAAEFLGAVEELSLTYPDFLEGR